MSTYVIGDIHGCFQTLEKLLGGIGWDPASDRLWLVGDLVNRGPGSLQVLRWVRDLGDACTTVLGNHDLHLLAVHAGVRRPRRLDTLRPILDDPECSELLDWVRELPLFHEPEPVDGVAHAMVHAGVHPSWTREQLREEARHAESMLRGKEYPAVLAGLQETGKTLHWEPATDPVERASRALRILAFIRTVDGEGRMVDFAGPPDESPADASPWFEKRAPDPGTLYFGHWAALGLHRADGVIGLDTGCAWGGQLTAIRQEDGQVFPQNLVERTGARHHR